MSWQYSDTQALICEMKLIANNLERIATVLEKRDDGDDLAEFRQRWMQRRAEEKAREEVERLGK